MVTVDSEAVKAFVERIDAVVLALLFVIGVLTWLLAKSLSRIDKFTNDIHDNTLVAKQLTTLIETLVYGRKKV